MVTSALGTELHKQRETKRERELREQRRDILRKKIYGLILPQANWSSSFVPWNWKMSFVVCYDVFGAWSRNSVQPWPALGCFAACLCTVSLWKPIMSSVKGPGSLHVCVMSDVHGRRWRRDDGTFAWAPSMADKHTHKHPQSTGLSRNESARQQRSRLHKTIKWYLPLWSGIYIMLSAGAVFSETTQHPASCPRDNRKVEAGWSGAANVNKAVQA